MAGMGHSVCHTHTMRNAPSVMRSKVCFALENFSTTEDIHRAHGARHAHNSDFINPNRWCCGIMWHLTLDLQACARYSVSAAAAGNYSCRCSQPSSHVVRRQFAPTKSTEGMWRRFCRFTIPVPFCAPSISCQWRSGDLPESTPATAWLIFNRTSAQSLVMHSHFFNPAAWTLPT